MMNPSPAFNHEEIDMTWTDEQIIRLLHDYTPESHLPRNVITYSNPFHYHPVNLPEDVWYLLDTGVSKVSDFGFWFMKTSPIKIHSNSEMVGWRTTWDYFSNWEDSEATPWLMQEYSITISGVSMMLCRIFKAGEHRNAENPVQLEEEDHDDHGNDQEPQPAMVPEAQVEPEQAQVPEAEPQQAPVPEAQDEPEPAPVPEVHDEPEPAPEAQLDLHQEMLLFDPENASSSSSSGMSTLTVEETLDDHEYGDNASEEEY